MAMGKVGSILLGGLAGLAFKGAKSIFGGKSSEAPKPEPLPQPPSPVAAADKAEDIIKKKRAAISQTVYTSPLGVAGEAQVARKTLLGQ